jgi:hypothetical protein
VHQVAKELATFARGLVIEAAKARFEKNFATPVCNNCDGLKAGPGVTATCFQVRQCFYSNIRAETTSREARIIDALTKKGSKHP